MMIRPALGVLLSLSIAGPASALSCLRPEVAETFRQADAAEASYVLAVGRIALAEGEAIPPQADPNDKKGFVLDATFEGMLASETGFDDPATFPVTIDVGCISAWCGGVPVGARLMFLERRDEDIVLVENACPMFSFPLVQENVDTALSCLTGGACESPG